MVKTGAATTTARPLRSYQKLSERLRQFMADGHFHDGDRLPPERSLAESFGVSRHGDGTYVRVPDMEPLRKAIIEAVHSEGVLFDEVTEYRRIVEPAIAELASLRRTLNQLDQLKIITCDQQRCLLLGEDDGALDARFHQQLAECAGNRLLAETITQLNALYAGGRTPELRDATWRQFSVSSHLQIIDALERQSPEEARKAAEAHIDHVVSKHLFATARD